MTGTVLTAPTGRRFTATRQGTAGRELALILPGLRSGCERPLLAQSAALLAARGADVVTLDMAYLGDHALFQRAHDDQLAEIAADGRALFEAVLGRADWERVTVLGKSLGTLQMAGIVAGPLPESTRMVWLTPSLAGTGLLDADLQRTPGFSLIGARDPSSALARGPRWAGRPGMTHLDLPGFDHGWEHVDGPEATASGTARAMAALGDWLDAAA